MGEEKSQITMSVKRVGHESTLDGLGLDIYKIIEITGGELPELEYEMAALPSSRDPEVFGKPPAIRDFKKSYKEGDVIDEDSALCLRDMFSIKVTFLPKE